MAVGLCIRYRRTPRIDVADPAVVGQHARLICRLATVASARVVVAPSAAAAPLRLQDRRERRNRYRDDKSFSHVSAPQKPYLIPNCMIRGSPVIVVIRPNVPEAKLLFGSPQLKVL